MISSTAQSSSFYRPGLLESPDVRDRKARFDKLNAFVAARHGWITSVPGDPEIRMECLPGSVLPDQLLNLGYDVIEIGHGERILAGVIEEHFARRADGELEPITPGSTAPVAEIRTHAGIVKVTRYAFDL
jgi:hypothetical protein